MKSILFPTDFGDTSRQILHYALNYAEALNAKSTIVHTYQPTMSPRRPIIGEGTYRQQILKKLRDFTTVVLLLRIYSSKLWKAILSISWSKPVKVAIST